MAEWIDASLPLVPIHLTYRKTRWDSYKMSVSQASSPPKKQHNNQSLSGFFIFSNVRLSLEVNSLSPGFG